MTSSPDPERQDARWEGILRRLEAAIRSTEDILCGSPEESARVLDERARLLAQPVEEKGRPAEELEIVAFRLGPERYGIETRYVHGVLLRPEVTRLPAAPDCFLGVTTLRGDILPVADLRPLFGIEAGVLPDVLRILVLGREMPEIGVLAEEIEEVAILKAQDVHPPPPVRGADAGLLRGVTAEARIVLLGDALLRDSRLFMDQRQGQAP
ncbi:MAG: purine-binding chemotaxis protein CheW [Planctomycetes bacterium]|nr:purine-binding chemotaxis protein CheW [Planctomycetota bacterium]